AATAAVAIDDATGEVLYAKSAHAQRSLASLTKLMTAAVLLEQGIDLDKVVTYHSSYDQIGARLYVTEGEQLTNRDLLYAMVIGSANNAAYALVGEAGYSVSDFVELMNAKAAEFGLADTTFADPSGLVVENYSTAYDYAQFMRQALVDENLTTVSQTAYYSFTTVNTGVFHDFANTNQLFATSNLDITGSKTGYIDEAGYCLAMRFNEADHAVISVVLGAATSSDRFNESERLANWVLTNYRW
ncbi:MAG: Penicillin-binding protein 7, partial [uncultured bacterium]